MVGGGGLICVGGGAYTRARAQVCLVASSSDHHGVRDDRAFVGDIWRRLRARFPACTIIFMPESNLGKEASHLEEYVHDDPLTVTMQEVKDGWYGVHKSHTSTLEMHKKMLHVLVRRSRFVAGDVIGVPTALERRKQGLVAGSSAAGTFMVGKLVGQLHAFRWEATGGRNTLAEEVFRLTGKGNKRNDDLCVACLMVPYWSQVFWQSVTPAYARAKARMAALGGGGRGA